MALAERLLAARFGDDLVDHHTYVIRRRRLPHGRHQPGSDLARRPFAARQADRASGTTITSPSTARPSSRTVRRPVRALRRRRLGYAARSTAMTPTRSPPRSRKAQDDDRAVDDRLPHHHRFRRADQGRHRRGAWLAAGRGRDRRRARAARLALRRLSTCPTMSVEAWREVGERGDSAASPPGASAWSPSRRRARRVRAPQRSGELPKAAGATRSIALRRRNSPPRRRRSRRARPRAACSTRWRRCMPDADRRLGRSHPLQQHQGQEPEGHRRATISPAATSITASASTAWPRR